MRRSRALVAGILVVGLMASACTGQPGATAGGASTTSPTTTAPPSDATATPSPAPSLPAASLDPGMSAAELFADATPASAVSLEEGSSETHGQAVVRDVRYAGADGRWVPAYLVRPTADAPVAGVLFLHWLGDQDSSREEFVDEALELAGRGVESMLTTQRFPWVERPSGVEHDRVAIGLQVRTIRRALAVLADEVGSTRIALVGHDYGAMYGILAASVDERVDALACMAPDSTWVNWFVTYFHVVDAGGATAYAAAMADLDPLTRLGEVDGPLLLQFGTSDFYVSSEVASALAEAAPAGRTVKAYDIGHRLDDAARTERDAWLLDRLGVTR
jgi:pimeloyl-ACP methyl ester carboxylesterase